MTDCGTMYGGIITEQPLRDHLAEELRLVVVYSGPQIG
jgi:hypothetical protein